MAHAAVAAPSSNKLAVKLATKSVIPPLVYPDLNQAKQDVKGFPAIGRLHTGLKHERSFWGMPLDFMFVLCRSRPSHWNDTTEPGNCAPTIEDY